MRVRVLQHVPFEGIGSMAAWLAGRDAQVRYTRFYQAPALPDTSAVDLVIVMGGPMSVSDQRQYPWLKPEMDFLGAVIRHGVPVVGICLGAQLIAGALGARVYPGEHKEIGWFSIWGFDTERGVYRFPDQATVFHWHGDTFDLPDGAVRLASSAACRNQGFQWGDNVIGLQFHLETTPDSVAQLVGRCRAELVPAPYVQPEQELLRAPADWYRSINALMADVLDHVCPR